MLLELAIRNFAIIRDLRITFGEGLQAMTGETGAGKSIIIDALGAVLGSRVSADFVRTDSESAWVEAVFDLERIPRQDGIREKLDELGIEHDDASLILTRDIRNSGRSSARINGRTVPARELATIGEWLVDIHGQSEHLSLLRPAEHLSMLDSYAGTTAMRQELSGLVRSYRQTRRRIDEIRSSERERAHQIDLLRFQVEEINGAALEADEEETLQRDRQVLGNAERLRDSAWQAYRLLEGDSETGETIAGALDKLREASAVLDDLAEVDPDGAGELAGQVRESLFLLEEGGPAVRSYAESVESDPARLEAVEERIVQIRELQRKYGSTIPEILAYAEKADAELAELDSSEATVDQLESELESSRSRIAELAGTLSQRRRAAAESLEKGVEQAIADLHMGGSVFRVGFDLLSGDEAVTIDQTERPFDHTGIDRVEFLIAPNAGQEPRPLARIASGGETARLMLALKSILSDADATPTLVFDEVDVGVGGRSGQAVGEKLWGLARGHQVIVISHLPQIAAFADQHLKITKLESAGNTETQIDQILDEERLDEIAAMLDGIPVTDASRQNAREMVRRIDGWKQDQPTA
ncbi:MAG: DNA repair protein RecN [Sphaerobacteraceae bacterium]|nr:MAG: DNA repair protein RecN [Sphaerobacteraceae bacterium]